MLAEGDLFPVRPAHPPMQAPPADTKTASLVRKLATVMGAVERVAKNGKNTFHGYAYATEADITQAVRAEMATQGVMMIPTVEKVEWTAVETSGGKKERLCTLHVLFTVLDSDSDSSLRFTIIGQGQDAGDKASYKAMTGATKYALLKLFLIPTGDDPEDEKAPKNIPPPAGVAALKSQVVAGTTKGPTKAPTKTAATAGWDPGEPPPYVDSDGSYGFNEAPEPPGGQRTHEDIVMGNFGGAAKAKLSSLSDDDLSFYRNACKRTLGDSAKAQYHTREALRLVAFDAELRFRGLPI